MKKRIACFLIVLLSLSCAWGREKVLRFHHLSTENGLPRNTVFSIVEDKSGYIWLATIDGICKFDGYRVTLYPSVKKSVNTPVNNRPLVALKDRDGNVWFSFSSSGDLCRYNYQTDDFTRFPPNSLPTTFTNQFNRDTHQKRVENSSYIWDVTTTFLVQTNKITREQFTYRYDPSNNYGLRDEMVLSVYLDSNNILWVATDVGGVCYADVNQPDFEPFVYSDRTVQNFSETAIRAICKTPNGDLWMGTRKGGLARIGPKNSKPTYLKHSERLANSVADNRIRKIYLDHVGLLWFGTKNGVDRLLDHSGVFKHYPSLDKQHSDNWIFAIEEDNQKNLWIGTWVAGVARYDRVNDRFVSYLDRCPSYTRQIRTLLKDGPSNLWIGTEGNGLTLMKRWFVGRKEQLSFTHFVHQPENPNSLSDDRVYSLCSDGEGFLWIGTGRGLNRLDPKTGNIRRFSDKRFLGDGMMYGILRDQNHLWVSHQRGLTRINVQTYGTNDYSNHDELFDIEFSEDAYYKDSKSNVFYFGGNLGYISFHPSLVKTNSNPPKIVLTDVRISGKSIGFYNNRILEKPIDQTQKIKLHWSERNVGLEFAALHFSNPQNNSYLYRLKGFDSEWKSADATNRLAAYSNLPVGKYVFEVKAANADGVWSKSPAELEIIILPPWWRTGWAYVFYLSFALGILYLIFNILLTRKNLQHQIQLEKLRSTFFTNISHELRTPLTLIIDPVKKLLDDKNPVPQNLTYFLQLIFDNSKRMLTLVNQLLDLKKVESKEMQLHVTLLDVVERSRKLVKMFDFQAQQQGIRLTFQTTENSLTTAVDTDKFDKILLNLLTNAFKFTPENGTIDVRMNCSSDRLSFELTVQDNGLGISAEKLQWIFDPFYQVDEKDLTVGTGIGLSLVKEFVELHRGSIRVDSALGKGSCFTVTFPMVNEGDADATVLPVEELLNHSVFESMQPVEDPKSLPIVLIVEDHAEVRRYLKQVLQTDFRTHSAGNGQEGYHKALEIMPDLVVSDIMMPIMSGVELCERLKTDPKTSHIPVILLTARQSEELILTSYETGADDYIAKPFSSTMLIARIKNLIESRRKLRQLFDQSTGYNIKVIASNQVDKRFLDKVVQLIDENMGRAAFEMEELASMLNMSRVQFNRKIKSLTDKTAQDFVLTIRLNKAAELLLSGLYNVSEVSEMVGYSEPTNFTRSFVRQFGETPKNYVANRRKEQALGDGND